MALATDWLRKKGLASAAKKAGRSTTQGLVGVSCDGNFGAIVEVNSETDFVARNDVFQGLVGAISSLASSHAVIETGKQNKDLAPYLLEQTTGDETLSELITKTVSQVGENIVFRRAETLGAKAGFVTRFLFYRARCLLSYFFKLRASGVWWQYGP